MNQFTTETIINRFKDAKNQPLFLVENNKFIAKKLFAFDKKYIKAIYRAVAVDAVPEEFKVVIPTTPHTYKFEGNEITSDVFRLHIEMKTVDANISEFQNSLTRNNKEYNFEVAFSENKNEGNKDSMAEAFVKAIQKQNNESKNPKFTVDANGEELTLTAIDGFTRFAKVEVQALETNYLGYNAYKVVSTETEPSVEGVSGFGTANWLMRNFRIPTYVNTNWLSLRQDDRPIPGVKYNQYTFHVEADRGELTGMGAVGQKMTSKTTHVLYVNENIDGDFKGLLTDKLKIEVVDYDCNLVEDEFNLSEDAPTAMKAANKPKKTTEENSEV